jgi:two-component sensor histidine kinase
VHIGGEGDRVLLEFRDNGPGYPEEVLRLERYNVGIYLIQNIVQEQLYGDLTFHNDQGAVTTIRFKAVP